MEGLVIRISQSITFSHETVPKPEDNMLDNNLLQSSYKDTKTSFLSFVS